MLNPEVGAENTKISKYLASTIHYLKSVIGLSSLHSAEARSELLLEKGDVTFQSSR